MVVLLVNELVNFLLDIFKIQPFIALSVDFCEQLVVMAMEAAATWVSSYYVGGSELTPVESCNVGLTRSLRQIMLHFPA